MSPNHPRDMVRQAFTMQRLNAKRRGIPFKLTYLQWLELWAASGVLGKRGKGSGKYQMARHGDQGAYEVGNVSIITHNQNSREIVVSPKRRAEVSKFMKQMPRTKTHRLRIGAAMKGRVFSAETRAKMSASAKNRRR